MFDKPHRLHPAAIIINFGTYFVAVVRGAIIPLVGLFFSASRKSSAQYMALLVGGITACIGAISLIGPILHYFSTTFYIEGDSLVISSGFVWRKRRTIPLARIQNVNVERTLWHRILGAAAVKVETAAGGKAEGDLTALSLEDANKLQAVLLHNREKLELGEEVEKPLPIYELSPKQVILAGALGNRALYILGSMFAVFQFEGARHFAGPVMRYVDRLSPALAIVIGALSFVGLIVIGWLLSIGISATRFFGFRIESHERGLLLTHGLITQFKTIVPVGRIQDVRIIQPVLFRAFGYCEVYADTAGSFDVKDAASANKICPILPDKNVDEIGKLLMPEFAFENLDWKRVSKKTVSRQASRHLIALIIFILIPLWFWLKWWVLIALPPLALYTWLIALVSYQYTGYAWTGDVLASRLGALRKHATIIPFDRIQHYSIRASLFQKWLGLASVSAVSAASGGHPILITDIDAKAAEDLRKILEASIQSHVGSRRGGL